MSFRRRRPGSVSDETVEFMRGIVEGWARTAGDLRQVTIERKEIEHLLCTVCFHERPDFTTTLLWCANAERLGVEAKLLEALNELSQYSDTEIFVSSLAEEVAIEGHSADK